MRATCLLLAALLPATIATAQVGFGAEGGIGISAMKFSPSQNPIPYTTGTTEARLSGKVGLLIDVPLNKHVYFQPGIGISRKGAFRSFSYHLNDSFNESVSQTLQLHYADLPLMLYYKSGIQGRGRVTLGIGPTLSYIIGGKNRLDDQGVFGGVAFSGATTSPIVTGTTVSGFDIGVTLSGGYELPTGLFFRATYYSGTQDIGTGTERDKNRTFHISTGYIIGRGRNINKETDDLIDHSE